MSREQFQQLFRGNEEWFGQYQADPKTGAKIRAWTRAGPIPDKAWDQHLSGEGTGIGIVPIMEEGLCYWGAIDLDDDDTDHVALAKKIKAMELPLIVCRSKSGGAHLFIFFVEPVPPIKLLAKLKRWSLQLEIENPPDDQDRVPPLEFFPKQVTLSDGQKGNWLNMPYFGGDKTGRYCVSGKGNKLSLKHFLDYAEQSRLTETELEVKKAVITSDSATFFTDGPPCLQTLHEMGFPRGTRNGGLFGVGVFLKLKYPDDWEDRLRDYNATSGKVDPSLDKDEIDNIISSLRRKDYSYKCSDAPLVGLCKRTACKKREYGIDKFLRNKKEALLPSIGQLIAFENGTGDPAVYELEISGISMTFAWDELLSIPLFRKACFRQRKIIIPTLKQEDWDRKLRDLIDDHLVIEVPNDAGPHGQFVAHLRDFLFLRSKSDRDEDVLQNKPWGEKGKVYFKSQALIEYLERKRFREMNMSLGIWNAIRREGGGFTSLVIAGADVDVWWMPIPIGEQTEEFKEKGQDGPDF